MGKELRDQLYTSTERVKIFIQINMDTFKGCIPNIKLGVSLFKLNCVGK